VEVGAMSDHDCDLYCCDEALEAKLEQELAEKTHCDVCGEFVCMDLDIFGNESGEGRVVDGVVVCSACLEKEECEE